MSPRTLFLACLLFAIGTMSGLAQGQHFDLDAYKEFLRANQSLTAAGLQGMHPAGVFSAAVPAGGAAPAYLAEITATYQLTSFELEQINRHGFVVTPRRSRLSFEEQFHAIYHEDLPLFISTDAILQTIHESYDNILKMVERQTLEPELGALLYSLKNQLPALEAKYGQTAGMLEQLRDVDVYCTVPLILLGESVSPYFADNATQVNELIGMIGALQPRSIPLFSSTPRHYDFSQFTVRGHYTTDSVLAKYFRAMMWLGRTEIYLLPPVGAIPTPGFRDVQRQLIDAALIAEGVRDGGGLPRLASIDRILKFMVGESDNVTLDSLQALLGESHVADASVLLDSIRCQEVQNLLKSKAYSGQRILSQIIMTDPLDPDKCQPASALLLLGQRFVIDSYVTGSLVYDRIIYQGEAVRRMLPSTLDVLFALGNNAAGQLLAPEMEQYHYAPNAAALRALIDAYPDEFWTSSMFNAWLAIIRSLNPPPVRTTLPPFMQTAAWWQEKMNTQLGSWAQLRHDNLLYAKQSYTGGIICSFPQSYVEPVPLFYQAVRRYAELGAARFGEMGDTWVQKYFLHVAGVADTLGSIAEKELSGTPLSDAEIIYLRGMLVDRHECGVPLTGWYPRMNYGGGSPRYVVADVHTAPTDAAGSPVGWVMHVGTGPVELAVVSAELPGVGAHAFVGPVMSYYEHLATNFKRLTDEEWDLAYAAAPTLRPSFVNLYMANAQGGTRGDGPTLLTDVAPPDNQPLPLSAVLYPNYPNPFNPSTVIPFSVTGGTSEQFVTLDIFDIHGQLVTRVFDGRLPPGNFTVVWNGRNAGGANVASGTYISRLRAAGQVHSRTMVLVR